MKSKGGNAIALLLGKAKAEPEEESAPESSKGSDDARAYFDTFASAMRDDDDEGAYEALRGLITSGKDD